MDPAKRQLAFAAGGRAAVQRMTYQEVVLTLVSADDATLRVTLTGQEACGLGTLLQCASGDEPAFGGFGALPIARAS